MARPFPVYAETGAPASDSKQRICAAAMRCFAELGTEAASVRMVADAAGVSIGLIQHYFPSKRALVAAVDAQLVAIMRDTAPSPTSPAEDTVADIGERITTLIEQHPDTLDYLAHLLINRSDTGQAVFDALLDIGSAQWTQLRAQGRVRADVDPVWGALNPLVLVLGTLILRPHIERQLPAPLTTPTQLGIWETALSRLISNGQLQPPS